MNNLTRRQKYMAMVILAAAVLIGSIVFSYFTLYAPARDARLQAEQTLTSQKEVLMSLQAQQKSAPPAEKISIKDLQHKVTVKPLTDAILLQVEEAELLSQSLVTSVNFTEAPLTLLQPIEGLENVQEVVTSVEFNAQNYEGITTFIEEIEKMERIMVVEAIDFTSIPEVIKEEASETQEPLTVSLSFASYYRPDLVGLENSLLKIDSPAPAKKANPFPKNGNSDLLPNKTEVEDVVVETQVSPDSSDPDVSVEVEVEGSENSEALVEQTDR
ncbi:MAG: pilus assembly protein PilO [Planococcus sp. (in: firmicutes)]|uniref:pilus assembly protein PilO n=1 Tax=Planococcus halocryophilus TaxID=1215089 RepID=UPI001F0E7BCB|nr:pilus assembly protein PilO [Planococcus halocryophilus]MCH4825628.1 pilus assembly protein PilO [Planococcus halocryophilus]